MGGDSFLSSPPSSEDASLSGQNLTHESINSSRDEDLSHELENALVIDGMKDSNSGKFPDVCPRFSAIDEAVERQRMKVFSEVLRSYKELQSRIDRLEEARNKILRFLPMAPKLLLIPIFSLIILVMISTTPTADGDDSSLHLTNETWNWELETQSNLEPEIIEDEDEDALHRRSLYWHSPAPRKYYISYGALSANRVPCPPRSGRSYYTHNCFKARGPVHPYTRGCSAITRCRR